jgi:DNA-directed RNA polymerase subunit RPC12/RpoP
MYETDILCPYCKNSHLREIKLPSPIPSTIWEGKEKNENIRKFYVCLSCSKMINEEELNI